MCRRRNSKKYKNVCKVKIRADRVCKNCGKLLPKGTVCLTLNTKGKGRVWVCPTCEGLLNDYLETDSGGVSFGDEGYAQFLIDEEDRLKGELHSLLEYLGLYDGDYSDLYDDDEYW